MPARPTVLLIDPQAERLRDLGTRLAAEGYEVVPVADTTKARRFVEGLDAAVIVTTTQALATGIDRIDRIDPAALLGGSTARTLVVLGADPADEAALPEEAAFLSVGGLEPPEIARRLLLVLLGREIGATPDASLANLIGDLAQTPLIELLRGLDAAGTSGRIDLRGGSLLLQRGAVIAAAAGQARGLKAFCRLGRLHEAARKQKQAAAATGIPFISIRRPDEHDQFPSTTAQSMLPKPARRKPHISSDLLRSPGISETM